MDLMEKSMLGILNILFCTPFLLTRISELAVYDSHNHGVFHGCVLWRVRIEFVVSSLLNSLVNSGFFPVYI